MASHSSVYAICETAIGPKTTMGGTTNRNAATEDNISATKTKAETCVNANKNELGHTQPCHTPDDQYAKYMD